MENCRLHFTFDDLILREIFTKLQHFMDHHIVAPLSIIVYSSKFLKIRVTVSIVSFKDNCFVIRTWNNVKILKIKMLSSKVYMYV